MSHYRKIFGSTIVVVCFALTLWQFGNWQSLTWNNPLYFLLLIPVPLLLVKWTYPSKSTAVKFSSIRNLKNITPGWRVRAYSGLPLLKAFGFICIVIALARPQIGDANTKVTSEGIAIMVAIDVSDSMRALDFATPTQKQNRLDVVKEVFNEFVVGNESIKGRRNDLIGIIAFGGYPESKCPLTLDHHALLNVLQKQVHIPKHIYNSQGGIVNGEELSTAIGDALVIGIERLKNVSGKSKVLILLTDGENTAGVADPLDSAHIAKDEKIKVYTIGVGTNGNVPFPAMNEYGEEVLVARPVRIDEKSLQKIAEITNGKYFHAKDKRALQKIYEEIDLLEKQEIKVTYLQYEEIYLWFLIPGVIFILLEKLLENTILRKVP